jgi:tryptophanase
MNYHFTTTKAHIGLNKGSVAELFTDEALKVDSTFPFKGNLDPKRLENFIKEKGADKIAYVRIESGTNLIGGQPHSLANLKEIKKICSKYKIILVYDASLLADNLYFIKLREKACAGMSIREITLEIAKNCDIIYFSARKLGYARGGGIITDDEALFDKMKELVPLFEGFLTYGGMSVREMEALAVGLDETMDYDMISQGPGFIAYMVGELKKYGIPVITPAGGLGCHLNAAEFVKHIPQSQYPAGALAIALYLISGMRGMERGTISEERKKDGSETLAEMELVRLALPRRVFTLSQVKYAIDRIRWLYENRKLIGGLEFYDEPKILRFFLGKLKPVSDWQKKLCAKFKADFGDN